MPPHDPPIDAHLGCDACHASERVVDLAPDDKFCLTCHAEIGEHYPEKRCTVCHLQETVEEFRPRLLSDGGGP